MTSSADRLLAECLRAYPERPAVDVAELDGAFWERARDGGVAVIVAEQLGVRTAETKARAMAQAVSAMRSETVTMMCLRLCDEMGIRAVPLKGPLLAKRLYGDIARRPTSDVDLLMTFGDMKRLIPRLVAEGAHAPQAHVHAYYEKAHHHLTVTWHGTLIELHFRATSDFGVFTPAEPLIERSLIETIDGSDVRVLESNDELVYLATHAAAHYLGLDSQLMDLKLLQRVRSIDWRTVERRAHALRLERAVGAALVAAERRVGFDASAMTAAWEAASRRLYGMVPRDLPPGYGGGWRVRLRQRVAHMRLCDTPVVAARTLGQGVWRASRRRLHECWPSVLPDSWGV